MCCRMLGFIMFWIAIGMIIALFMADNLFWAITLIVILLILGFNLFMNS